MTNTSDLVAAYLAKGGAVTVAAEGVAYGVDPAADRAKRLEARAAYAAAWSYKRPSESAYERQAEAIREAYHTGGRNAAVDAMGSR